MANPKKKFSFLDSNFFLISLVRNMYIPKHTPVQCVKQRKKYLTWYMYQVLVPQTSQDQLPVGRVTTMSQTTYTSRMVRTIFSTVFFTSFITTFCAAPQAPPRTLASLLDRSASTSSSTLRISPACRPNLSPPSVDVHQHSQLSLSEA